MRGASEQLVAHKATDDIAGQTFRWITHRGGAPAAAVPVQEPREEAALPEDANDGHNQSSSAPAEEAVGFLSEGEDLDAEAGSFMPSSNAVEDEGW